MSAPLFIGLGCRAGCPGPEIAALITRARGLVDPVASARLFTVEDKRHEDGLREAASALRLRLVFLPRAVLAAAKDRVATSSPASAARFGLPSVSEAAALAGAGPGARLVLPRLVAGGATCAIAIAAEEAS